MLRLNGKIDRLTCDYPLEFIFQRASGKFDFGGANYFLMCIECKHGIRH